MGRTATPIVIMGQWEALTPEAKCIRAELPKIRQIVQDECWLEDGRRGGAVDPGEAIVQNRVAEIILSGLGEHLREQIHLHPPAL
jgi:hypothetical protein